MDQFRLMTMFISEDKEDSNFEGVKVTNDQNSLNCCFSKQTTSLDLQYSDKSCSGQVLIFPTSAGSAGSLPSAVQRSGRHENMNIDWIVNTDLFSEHKQHSFPELNIVERNDGEEEEHTIEYRDGDVL